MAELNGHWTNRSHDDFLFRIAFDFVNQVMNWMEEDNTSRAELAQRLGVSKGRVSQVLNDPGNLRLKTAVEFARVLKRKIAIVGYDDRDPGNQNGPINGQVFTGCWENTGKPRDLYEFQSLAAGTDAWGFPSPPSASRATQDNLRTYDLTFTMYRNSTDVSDKDVRIYEMTSNG